MLATNICIGLLNRRTGYENILARIDGIAYKQVVISSVTLAELKHCIAKSVKKKLIELNSAIFCITECLHFDVEATSCYGDIRIQLESGCTSIGPLDTLIAAHTLSLAATIVTNNVRGFERVDGLAIEKWIN